jgi:hypothetical protein
VLEAVQEEVHSEPRLEVGLAWYWALQMPQRLVVAEMPLLELGQLEQEHTAEA